MLKDELMLVIRRNTKPSKCVDNFGDLLNELEFEDPEYMDLVVKSMFKFITEEFELFETIKRVPQRKFVSRMLDPKFIDPSRFFIRVKRLADQRMEVRAAIELLIGNKSRITVDTGRRPFKISKDRALFLINRLGGYEYDRTWEDWHVLIKENLENYLESVSPIFEIARKDMLLWNYIPAIVKAIIQSKKREYGIDDNYGSRQE